MCMQHVLMCMHESIFGNDNGKAEFGGDEENQHCSWGPICSSMIFALLLAICMHVYAKCVNVNARVYIWY